MLLTELGILQIKWIFPAICIVTFIQKMVRYIVIGNLKRDTDALPELKGKWIKKIKQQLENTYYVNRQIDYLAVFLEKQIRKNKLGMISVGKKEKGCKILQLTCWILGGIVCYMMMGNPERERDIPVILFFTVMSVLSLQIFQEIFDVTQFQKEIRENLVHYFGNILIYKLEKETEECITEKGKNQTREKGMTKEEENQIIQEVLQEFLA